MTSNPDYIPLVDIIQGHFHKSFELLIKIGLWLVVNSECCLWSTGWSFPTVLMSAATGCKLAMLGWNKIEHQNTFFQYFFHFYPISGIHWTLKMPYVFKHLEVYMKTWFHYCFIKKWFHTILYHFKTGFVKIFVLKFMPVDFHQNLEIPQLNWLGFSENFNINGDKTILWLSYLQK